MTEPSRYEAALRRILHTLAPYGDDLVVIGGWVPYLYQRYGGFRTWRTKTSRTTEVDILVVRSLAQGARPTIAEILSDAGFEPTAEDGGLAVWEGDVSAGEMIEFLVPHTGTAREMGRVVPVTQQPGMGAITLPDLELMRTFRRRLAIPALTSEGEETLEIWVPTLGAYVVNKASTFQKRSERVDSGNPKRAKDLLYLRDLMGAGAEVVRQIETDLREMTSGIERRKATESIRYARNTLHLALGDSPLPREVAAMLVEREPAVSLDAAVGNVRGHLRDLVEVFDDVLR